VELGWCDSQRQPHLHLGGLKQWVTGHQVNFQNDFVYEHTATSWKSQTVMGYAFNYHSQNNRWRLYTPDATIYDLTNNYTPPGYTLADWLGNVSTRERSSQVYLYGYLKTGWC